VAERQLSEDSLTVNVWTPAGEAPRGGWPVYAYLHGGWLQIGNPAFTDKNNPADLLGDAGMKVSTSGSRIVEQNDLEVEFVPGCHRRYCVSFECFRMPPLFLE
jgi:hypothetical protein